MLDFHYKILDTFFFPSKRAISFTWNVTIKSTGKKADLWGCFHKGKYVNNQDEGDQKDVRECTKKKYVDEETS